VIQRPPLATLLASLVAHGGALSILFFLVSGESHPACSSSTSRRSRSATHPSRWPNASPRRLEVERRALRRVRPARIRRDPGPSGAAPNVSSQSAEPPPPATPAPSSEPGPCESALRLRPRPTSLASPSPRLPSRRRVRPLRRWWLGASDTRPRSPHELRRGRRRPRRLRGRPGWRRSHDARHWYGEPGPRRSRRYRSGAERKPVGGAPGAEYGATWPPSDGAS